VIQNDRVGLSFGHGRDVSGLVVMTFLPPENAFDAQTAHQPFHGAAGSVLPLPSQDVPDLARPIEFAVVLPRPVDLEAQGGIRIGTRRGAVRITCNGAPVIIAGRGKLQRPADRLDPV
jgi:hypothetical protein